jgi:hypothetical protein
MRRPRKIQTPPKIAIGTSQESRSETKFDSN